MTYFNQPVRRQAKFIAPKVELKQKVGYGGLAPEILEKAQAVVDEATHDFIPMASQHLTALNEAVRLASAQMETADGEALLMTLITPAMQLKGHGGMFGYESISYVASRLVQFLEVVEGVDPDMLEIASSYYTAMNALIVSRIENPDHAQTKSLYEALNNACLRYFEKHAGA